MAGRFELRYGTNIPLRDHSMICLRRFPRRSQVACLSGRLWLTFDGDVEDHILLPGDWYLPHRSARGAIIYAIETSLLVVLKGERASPANLVARLIRALRPSPLRS